MAATIKKVLITLITTTLCISVFQAKGDRIRFSSDGSVEQAFNSIERYFCNPGEIKLVGGRSQYEGRVEVCLRGFWGTICNDLWNRNNARVACRQLGYSEIDAIPVAAYPSFGLALGPIHFDELECSGLEENLSECLHNSHLENNCRHKEDAGVKCFRKVCVDGDIQLFGSTTASNGGLAVCKDEKWWTIGGSSVNWRTNEAAVICRQLTLSDKNPIAINDASLQFGLAPFATAVQLTCTGEERSAAECKLIYNNTGQDYAGVWCEEQCTQGSVRVDSNAGGLPIGRVTICLNETWRVICPNGWTDDDASVVCGQLGHPRQGAVAFTVPRGHDYPLVYNNQSIECVGKETYFLDCRRAPRINCVESTREAAAVQCLRRPCEDGDLRLVDGQNELEGRVEVCWMSTWGTVCYKGFSEDEATVACRQLGYSKFDAAVLNRCQFPFGDGNTWLSDVKCQRSKTKLTDCQHYGLGRTKCTFLDDVGVRCKPRNCEDGDVRLMGRNINSEGLLQVCTDEEWFNICNEDWTFSSSEVVCRQLGYETYDEDEILFQLEAQELLQPPFQCSGSEDEVLLCTQPTKDAVCSTTDPVVIVCYTGLASMIAL